MTTPHPEVQRVLRERGIKLASAEALGLEYLTPEGVQEVLRRKKPIDVPGILIPYFDAAGEHIPFARVKLLGDYIPEDERKPVKYLQSSGTGNHIYIPPDIADATKNPQTELIVTEGEWKAIKASQEGFAAVGIGGVSNWRSRDDDANSMPSADFYTIVWAGRIVYLIFDSDVERNVNVRQEREALRSFLWKQGALVYLVDLPNVGDNTKTGLDDYLVAEGRKSLRKLLDLARSTPIDPPHDLWAATDIAPPLRRGLLPKTLDAFAFESPQTVDPTALGFATLAVCAMAASDNLRVRVSGGWRERACLWIVPYGESGVGKSPIIKAAAAPLEAIAAEQDDRYLTRKTEWAARKKADKAADPGPEPQREPRLLTHDATSAAASEILKSTDHGIGIVNDEISTVLASMDNTRDSKGAAERGPMLKLYDGGRHEMDRVTRGGASGGVIISRNWSASLLGGVTTDRLANLAKVSVADGMLPRCMLVQTQRLPPNSSLGSDDSKAYLAYKDLVRKLVETRPDTPQEVGLTPEARERLGAAKMKWQQLASDVAAELPRYAERISKLTGQAARMGLLLMMIEACENPTREIKIGAPGERGPRWTDITGEQMERAIDLLELQQQHDLAFYRAQKGSDISPGLMLAREVGRWILREHVMKFNQREITHSLKAWTQNVDDRTKRDALLLLQEFSWTGADRRDWFDYSNKIAHGVQWAVNPLVHEAFRPQAEAARREAEAVKLQMAERFATRRAEKATLKGEPC